MLEEILNKIDKEKIDFIKELIHYSDTLSEEVIDIWREITYSLKFLEKIFNYFM